MVAVTIGRIISYMLQENSLFSGTNHCIIYMQSSFTDVLRHISSTEDIMLTASFIRKCGLNHQKTLKGTEMAFGDVLYEAVTRSSGLGEVMY
jgi:hypothetical protein